MYQVLQGDLDRKFRSDRYPVLSFYCAEKRTVVAPVKLQQVRNEWDEGIAAAARIAVVGVAFNAGDQHVIEPIRRSGAAGVFYVGSQSGFADWRELNPRSENVNDAPASPETRTGGSSIGATKRVMRGGGGVLLSGPGERIIAVMRKETRFRAAMPLVALLLAAAGSSAGEPATALLLSVRDSYLPGVPLLVRVELLDAAGELAREVWDADAELSVDGGATISRARMPLFNGRGSALVDLSAAGDVTLTARYAGLSDSRPLVNIAGAKRATVSGRLPDGVTEWSGVVHVNGDTSIPAGSTLRVLPGTLVLLDGVASGEDGVDIDVEGIIDVQGTSVSPVTFTAADSTRPWGELDHDGAQPSTYRYTNITRAGHSDRGGHTNTGPAVRPRNGSRIVFENCNLSDNAGKVMQASSGAALEFRGCHLARSVMGPEIDGTALVFESSHITEMHGDDDNDGIYLHDQRPGQVIALRGAVVACGDDDAIDTLGSDVTIENCIVRDFADKGISVFHQDVLIKRCLIVGNDIGISAKTNSSSGARVTVDHCTIVENRIGIEARDKSGVPDAEIDYTVSSSIIREPIDPEDPDEVFAIRTDYHPSFITVRYSDLSGGWEGPTESVITSDPMFADTPSRDFRLRAESPCIDSGDPDAPLDPDGSRTDMGVFRFDGESPATSRFVRGEVNGDGARDISDVVRLLLFLFATSEIDCADAADSDDDGKLDIVDAILLLEYLFRAGPPPSAPASACGTDPTEEDVLNCARGVCAG